ncbi:MAG: hypothetical protein BroJett018_49900 [Chloroflexota bacterium]|nr:hypothetical protein [Chloroflexota bacterium]NOG64403.1 WD40 repeat domain-containing protein [Chloroflexota bacterium]GIK67196.1 MAG: hypothetical protein BroJett018_49900 [Chloroflexota bacterium]
MRRRLLGLIVGIAVIGLFTGGQGIRAQDDGDKNLVPITPDNVGQLEQMDTWEGDESAVTSVEFSRRDPNLIAYGTMAGYTYLGQLDEDTVTQLAYGTGPIMDVAFNPSGDYLASGRRLSDAMVWSLNPPEIYAVYQRSGSVLSVVFSVDGSTLAFSGSDLIDVSDGEPIPGGGVISLLQPELGIPVAFQTAERISETTGQINSIAYSPNGIHIAAGIGGGNSIESGGRVKIWDVETLAEVAALEGHTGAVWDVKYDPTGQYIASASADTTVRLWDTTTGKTVMTFKGHTDEVNAMAFSPDGTLLASVGSDGTLRFWDVATGEQVSLIDLTNGGANPVWDIDFSADGTMVATASEDGFVRLWAVKGE